MAVTYNAALGHNVVWWLQGLFWSGHAFTKQHLCDQDGTARLLNERHASQRGSLESDFFFFFVGHNILSDSLESVACDVSGF